MDKIIFCFFTEVGLTVPPDWKRVTVEHLIVQNIAEKDARHLMLLTRNNAALSLLLDKNILQQDNIEIIFGSDFPLDQNDLQVCVNIQRVKVSDHHDYLIDDLSSSYDARVSFAA